MEPTAMVLAAALASTAVIGCAVVRVIPAGHRGVVTRFGRVTRSRHAGLVAVIPGVERVEMVALHPRTIDPLTVAAMTRDGVEVRLVLSVLWCVVDPAQAVQAFPDARAATAGVIERAIHHLVAAVGLGTLLREREAVVAQLPISALPAASSWGVQVVDADLLELEVRVGPELLRLLR